MNPRTFTLPSPMQLTSGGGVVLEGAGGEAEGVWDGTAVSVTVGLCVVAIPARSVAVTIGDLLGVRLGDGGSGAGAERVATRYPIPPPINPTTATSAIGNIGRLLRGAGLSATLGGRAISGAGSADLRASRLLRRNSTRRRKTPEISDALIAPIMVARPGSIWPLCQHVRSALIHSPRATGKQ